jgi:hypothetical protein
VNKTKYNKGKYVKRISDDTKGWIFDGFMDLWGDVIVFWEVNGNRTNVGEMIGKDEIEIIGEFDGENGINKIYDEKQEDENY